MSVRFAPTVTRIFFSPIDFGGRPVALLRSLD
jgi:hypothetical protein